MSLQTILDAFRTNWERRVGPGVSCVIDDAVECACANQSLASAVGAGVPFPLTTTLLDQNGGIFKLAAYADKKPLIVKIYRGGWCPYCRIDLRAFQAFHEAIEVKGAKLVAISPELPKFIEATVSENDLTFPVLSDHRGELTTALGLNWNVTPKVITFLQNGGLDLKARHGADTWFLPAPATYVLSPDLIIAEAFVSPDFRKRTDPEKILGLL
jgi:peroxiredoxin